MFFFRFNVKNPFNNTREHEDKKKKPIFESNQLFALLGSARQSSDKTSDKKDDIKEENEGRDDDSAQQVKQERIDPRNVVLVKDETEIQAQEKPPMDLFKAIFADSSDESQSEGEGDDNTNNLSLLADNTMKRSRGDDGNGSSGSRDSSRHDSPANGGRGPNNDAARGIFAGINFDKFEKRRRKTPPPVVPLKALTSRPKSILDRSVRNILGIKSGDVSDDEYGPVAPPTVLAANAAAQSIRKATASPLRRKEENAGKSIVISSDETESSDSEAEWQEKEKGREKGKKKKKGKDKEKEKHKKEKKSKKKRKKKKHKSSKSDSD